MVTSFVEAYLNSNQFGLEKWFERFAGLTRIGDLVSDLLFIREMAQFSEVFDDLEVEHGEYYPPITRFLIAASVFTSIGLIFDLYRAYFELEERCNRPSEDNEVPLSGKERLQKAKKHLKSLPEKSWARIQTFPTESIKRVRALADSAYFWKSKDKQSDDGIEDEPSVGGDDIDDNEDDEGKWKWWTRANLVLEEIPQLIILICFYSAVLLVRDCDRIREKFKDVNCDAERARKLHANVVIPEVIIQTSPDKQQIVDTSMSSIKSSWPELNPESEMLLFDEEEMGSIVDKHFASTPLRQLETSSPPARSPTSYSPTISPFRSPTASSPTAGTEDTTNPPAASAPSANPPTTDSPTGTPIAKTNSTTTGLTPDEIKDYCEKRKYIEFACNDEQQEYINGLYVSSVMSSLFTSITILVALVELIRADKRKLSELYAASCCVVKREDVGDDTPSIRENDSESANGTEKGVVEREDVGDDTPSICENDSESANGTENGVDMVDEIMSQSVRCDGVTEGWEMACPIFKAVRERRECHLAFPGVDGAGEVLSAISDVINSHEDMLGAARATVTLDHAVGPVLRLSFPPVNNSTSLDVDSQFSSLSLCQHQEAKDEMLLWVDRFLCPNRLCPYVRSSQEAAIGLSGMGVSSGPVAVRVVGESNAAETDVASGSNDQYPAAALVSEFWEAVSTMSKTPETTMSTVLLVAPSYDQDFKSFIDVCDGLIEASISATDAAASILGRAWFHPLYDADAVGHDTVRPGHALPHKVLMRRVTENYSRDDHLESAQCTLAHLTSDTVARANDAVRRTPHATVNILRRSQLMAAQGHEAANQTPTNAIHVQNIVQLTGLNG